MRNFLLLTFAAAFGALTRIAADIPAPDAPPPPDDPAPRESYSQVSCSSQGAGCFTTKPTMVWASTGNNMLSLPSGAVAVCTSTPTASITYTQQ